MTGQTETGQNDTAAFVGRVLIGALFFMSGVGKLAAPGATEGYIAAVGLPAPVLAYVGSTVVELVGSALLIVGFQTRLVAAGLAAFTVLAAVFFHANFADQNQVIHFMKNIAITGGLLQVVAFGAGKYSLDRRFSRPAELRGRVLAATR